MQGAVDSFWMKKHGHTSRQQIVGSRLPLHAVCIPYQRQTSLVCTAGNNPHGKLVVRHWETSLWIGDRKMSYAAYQCYSRPSCTRPENRFYSKDVLTPRWGNTELRRPHRTAFKLRARQTVRSVYAAGFLAGL